MHKQVRTLAAALVLLGTTGGTLLAQTANQPPRAAGQNAPRAFEGIAHIALLTRPASGYRLFDIRQNATYAAGENLFIYGEPVNFGTLAQNGRTRFHVAVDIDFLGADGRPVDTLPNPVQLINEFDRGVRNLFVNVRRQVPNLAPGQYQVRIVFRDMFSGATVTTTRRVTITPAANAPGQPQAQAPVAPASPRTPPPQAQAPTAPPAPQTQAPQPPRRETPAAEQSHFSVLALQFVENQAPGYRQHTPRRSNVYAPGERFHIYFEPQNLRTRFDGRTLHGAMSVDIILHTAAGQLVGEQRKLWNLPVAAEANAEGPFLQLFASLSTSLNVPQGAYRITLRINDDLAGTSTEAVLDIAIQGAPVQSQAPAPQAQAPQTPAPQAPAPQAQAPNSPDTPPRRSVTGLLR